MKKEKREKVTKLALYITIVMFLFSILLQALAR